MLAVMCRASASRTIGDSRARPACLVRVDRMESPRGAPGAWGWLADIAGLRAGRGRWQVDAGRASHQARLRFMQLLEGGQAQVADHLAPLAPGVYQSGQPQDAQVPADEGLRQPHAG